MHELLPRLFFIFYFIFFERSKSKTHFLLLDILDNQVLPIPDEPMEEKKVIIKPPIPEKPVSLNVSSNDKDLHVLVVELIKLVKDQHLPPNHPMMDKVRQIESFLRASGVSLPFSFFLSFLLLALISINYREKKNLQFLKNLLFLKNQLYLINLLLHLIL